MTQNRPPEWFRNLQEDPVSESWSEMNEMSPSSRGSSARSRTNINTASTRTSYDHNVMSRASYDTDDPFIEVSQSRESSAKYGRRSSASSASTVRRLESKLAANQKSLANSDNIEHSLSSLNIFDRLQRDKVDNYNIKPLEKNIQKPAVGAYTLPDSFVIPELPEGQQLVINIRSTWGDRYYVGLNGIEMFSSDGRLIVVREIWANPPDINVLPEYSNDPRVVTNLINGVYRTTDDLNLWLAPFTSGRDHFICITFEHRVQLAMMRIWNYNKSRIHSYRGARDVEITLDGHLIFHGEIKKACGNLTGPLMDAFGDMILFTLDEKILEMISKNDVTFITSEEQSSQMSDTEKEMNRPLTASSDFIADDMRPFTMADLSSHKEKMNPCKQSATSRFKSEGQRIEITLLQNWAGKCNVIGLTSIEIFGEDEDSLYVHPGFVTTSPYKVVEVNRLFDGNNVTTDANHMVLFERNYHYYKSTKDDVNSLSIIINFDRVQNFNGIRIWNYNPSLEESYLGVKLVCVHVDGQQISPPNGYLIRRAPGNRHYDFAQEIDFTYPQTTLYQLRTSQSVRIMDMESLTPPENPVSRMSVFEEYEPIVMPRGFVFQFQLFSAWSDVYYVGLNGLEMYDAGGNIIPLSGGDIAAFPDSVNVLDGINSDVRTPDRLIDGVNDTRDARHMWLAPILPNIVNRVYIIFEFPVTVSMIKLWNYADKPSRGVKDFALFVDDLIVYHGVLKKANSNDGFPITHSTILFTKDDDIYRQERLYALRSSANDSNFANDTGPFGRNNTDQSLRPLTSLPPSIFSSLE